MKVYSVEEILQYKNPFVIERFIEKFPVNEKDAEELFEETLKLLWLMDTQRKELKAGTITGPKRIQVYKQMVAMDEMWHNFILFSREYTRFCRHYFGRYLHHVPTTSLERKKEYQEYLANPAEHAKNNREEIERQCRYVAEKLGPGTLTKWFKAFPDQFPAIRSSSKPFPANAAAAQL